MGDGRGKDAGAGESAEKDGGEKSGWMHCQSSVLVLWMREINCFGYLEDGCSEHLEMLLKIDLDVQTCLFYLPLLKFILVSDPAQPPEILPRAFRPL